MVMERSEFEQSLAQATRTAIEAARAVVLDDLSESARYWAGIGFEEGRGPAPDGDVLRKELALPGDDVRGPWGRSRRASMKGYFFVRRASTRALEAHQNA
jgi:hypothetical protein